MVLWDGKLIYTEQTDGNLSSKVIRKAFDTLKINDSVLFMDIQYKRHGQHDSNNLQSIEFAITSL